MISEIVNFIKYLEYNDPDIFSENLKLKQGLYVLLGEENGELVPRKIFRYFDDKVIEEGLYKLFLAYYINAEALDANKSFNSNKKIFIGVASPFAIATKLDNFNPYSKNNRIEKLDDALDEYFKSAAKFIEDEEQDYKEWLGMLKKFMKVKFQKFISDNVDFNSLKKKQLAYYVYFFMEQPSELDYKKIYDRYLNKRLFNKDEFNIKIGERTYGISDMLNTFNEKKTFLKHLTAPFDLNYRIDGEAIARIYKFFRLKTKNKVLPNPFPLFIDKYELSDEVIRFYKEDSRLGHKEIVERLYKKHNMDLSDYYLIYFVKNGNIGDVDFVPVFRYKLNPEVTVGNIFKVPDEFYIGRLNNVFDIERKILPVITNNILVAVFEDGVVLRYFDTFDPKSSASNYVEKHLLHDSLNITLKYRKAFFDYIYKSRTDQITDYIFHEVVKTSIFEDLRRDEFKADKKYHTKEISIKQKLNIWFSLYSYFSNPKKNSDMANKIKDLQAKLSQLVNESDAHLDSDVEFAFAAGQLIRYILEQNESATRTHALLEPFLQKTSPEQFKSAIAREFEKYKHAFKLYNGVYAFDKVMSEVMAYEPETDLKKLLPFILAGYFSELIFYKTNKQ